MKVANKVTIYDNDYSFEAEKSAREYLWETREENEYDNYEEWKSPDDIPDSLVWDELSREDESNWDECVSELKPFIENGTWLAIGSLGLWDGRHEGGCYIRQWSDFMHLFKDCDYIRIYDDGGHLRCEGTHHDGTNCYEIVGITERGKEFMESWRFMTRREEHQAIMSCNFYHRLPHFAKKVYGCKEFKYVPDKKKASPMPVLTTTFTGGAGEVPAVRTQTQNA